MKEELDPNEDVLQGRQIRALTDGRSVNRQRSYVCEPVVVLFLLLALAGLCVWMLRLLGVLQHPFSL